MSDSLPPSFNPAEQLLNYTSVLGPTQISFGEIDDYCNLLINQAAIFAARIGAAGLAMIAIWFSSKSKKTPVFILNQLSLFFLIFHSAFYIRYLLGAQATATYYFTGFPSLVSQYSVNIYTATNIFQLLLTASIQCSIVFQVYTMFNHPDAKYLGRIVTVFAGLVALSVVGLDFYNVVMSIKTIFGDKSDYFASRSVNAEIILFASSINFMSFILVVKLVWAIRARRYLGLKQFDSFHILLIMSFQSMLIPSILTILSYALTSLNHIPLNAVSVMLVALSLPLSSMWASSSNNSPNPTSTGYHVYTPSSFSRTPYSATLNDYESATKATLNKYQRDQFSPEKEIATPTTISDDKKASHWFNSEMDNQSLEDEEAFIAKTTLQLNTTHGFNSGSSSNNNEHGDTI